ILSDETLIRPSGDTPGQKDANVSMIEARTGDINFGGGIGSNSGAFGTVMIRQRNFDIMNWPTSFSELFSGKAFTGAGQQMAASWYPGVDQTSYGIDFTDPYLADMPVSFSAGISSFQRYQEVSEEERFRMYLGVEKRYEDRWRRGITLRVEEVTVGDLDSDAPSEIVKTKGRNDLFGLKFNIRKDTTNSRFTPSKGYHFNASYEQVTGDYTFGIVSATQRWYKTVYEDLAERRTILETKFHASSIVGDAPHFEKFFAGGSNSIRGFEYRGVSPRGINPLTGTKGDVPIGSDWIVTANSELAVPITSEVFSWLFFADSGIVETGGVRASVGTGVQILLPQWFGPVPMRFEFAVPVAKDEQDDTQTFSFSVGALF
ncbi:MAG: BamA/TamA family outer membrane protein, partial [Anaerohalosphaera sp.]|nr:BamA/TamA family outer membrane protein [Anaerohalosphaera sp.]